MKKEVKATMANKAHEEIPGNPSVSSSSDQKLSDRSNRKSLRVLSEEDWKFWMHNGYIVIKNAIPKEQAKATANFIWEFDEKNPNDTSTWYAKPRAEMKMKNWKEREWLRLTTTKPFGTTVRCKKYTMPL